MTHGSKSHREHGSIGSATTPSRVYPGLKMAGQVRDAGRLGRRAEEEGGRAEQGSRAGWAVGEGGDRETGAGRLGSWRAVWRR